MGIYTYKVTSKEVLLDNGQIASVAVFAYKPYGWDEKVNNRMHFTSGAGTCDRNADTRHDWIVIGHVESNRTIVEKGAVAKHVGKRGSFNDGWFDVCTADTAKVEAALVGGGVTLSKHESVETSREVTEQHIVTHCDELTYYQIRGHWQLAKAGESTSYEPVVPYCENGMTAAGA